MKRHIKERLAALHIEIDENAAERHLGAVAAELIDPSQPASYRRPRRVKVGALFAAALLLLLPGAAFASEGAVPGDLLYPIKLAAERVLLLIDPNIEAEHRIEEVEELVDRSVPFEEISDRLADADRSIQDRGVPDDLLVRLDVVRDRVATDYGRDVPPVDERRDGPVESDRPEDDVRSGDTRPSTTTTPATTSTTTTPPVTDRPPPTDSTTTAPPQDDRPASDATTTTEPPRDRDDPPRDG